MKITNELKKQINTIFNDNSKYEHVCSHELLELSEIVDNKNDKQVLSLLGNIMNLGYQENLENPFIASSIVIGVNFTDFKPADFENLEKIIDDIESPLLLSYVANILWHYTKKYEYAVKSINAYKTLFEETFDVDKWTKCLKHIERAYKLANSLGRKSEEYLNLHAYIHDRIIEIDGTDPLFLSIKLIKLLLPNSDKKHLNDFIKISDKIIANARAKKHINVHRIDAAFDLKTDLLKKLRDNDALLKAYADYAKYTEEMAETHSSHYAVMLYKKSALLYKQAKQTENLNRIMKLIEPLEKSQLENMHTFSQQIDLSDSYNHTKEFMENRSLQEQIIYMCSITKFYKKQEIEDKLISECSQFIIRSLFTTSVLDKHGKTAFYLPPIDLSEPKKDPDLFELHMHRKALELQDLDGLFSIGIPLDFIKEYNTNIDFDDLNFLIDNNILIPDDRKNIFKRGILLGLNGDFYTALHILAPQMENFF